MLGTFLRGDDGGVGTSRLECDDDPAVDLPVRIGRAAGNVAGLCEVTKMPPYERVASVADIPPGHAKAVVAGGREIAIFNIDGTLYATEATCPHQGGPLAEGWLDGTFVTCPWHAWSFDVRTGEMALSGPFCELDTFDVRLTGTDVEVSAEPRR